MKVCECGADLPPHANARGLCMTCYQRWWRAEHPEWRERDNAQRRERRRRAREESRPNG